MTCALCPDSVTFTLRNVVQEELDKVTGIQNKTQLFNAALEDIAGLAEGTVASAELNIPSIPSIDFTDILGYLTCPLTPLALAIDDLSELTELDPRTQLRRLQNLFKGEIDKARRDYEDALDIQAAENQLIFLCRKYANEMTRTRFDEGSFANAILISATVLAVCGVQEYTEGPYLDFANAIQDFSLVGGLPDDLDQNIGSVVQKMISSELTFKAQQKAITTLAI